MTSKADQERMWYLATFALWLNGVPHCCGWTHHRLHGTKKWDAAVKRFINLGFLESDDTGLYRITPAGIEKLGGL